MSKSFERERLLTSDAMFMNAQNIAMRSKTCLTEHSHLKDAVASVPHECRAVPIAGSLEWRSVQAPPDPKAGLTTPRAAALAALRSCAARPRQSIEAAVHS